MVGGMEHFHGVSLPLPINKANGILAKRENRKSVVGWVSDQNENN